MFKDPVTVRPASAATGSHTLGLAALLVSLFLLPGCGTPWRVQRQATPNPFLGAKQFALGSVTFTNLVVGAIPESAYLERKNDRQRTSWQADQQALAQQFSERLQSKLHAGGITLADGAAFTIAPAVTRMEPGAYLINTEVDMNVRILDASGETLDEVTLLRAVPFDLLTGAASGTRVRTAGAVLGDDFGRYLRSRTKK